MNPHFFYFLLMSCLLFSACSSSNKKSQESLIQDQAAKARATQSDQQPAEQQTPQQQPAEQQTPQQKMPPAPGSAQVTAEILSMENTPGGFHCTLKIISINGYGSSTPPLPEGTLISASVKKALLEEAGSEEAGSEEATSPKKLAPGMVKDLTLKYQQVLSIPGADTTAWRILSIR